jgi:hypothetical protein
MEELQRVAQEIMEVADDADAVPKPEPRIAFPGGLSVSLEHARGLLTGDTSDMPRPTRPPPRQGPLPEFQVRWSYQTETQVMITAIVPLGADRMLVCDQRGDVHCVDANTGKLLWRENLLPAATPRTGSSTRAAQRWQQIQSAQQMLATMPPAQQAQMVAQIQQEMQRLLAELGIATVPLVDDEGRIYVPGPSRVSCFSGNDGQLVWEAEVGALTTSPTSSRAQPGLGVSLLFSSEELITFAPQCGTVTKIDPATGKILWYREYPFQTPAVVTAHNSGISLCGRRLLVYAGKTAILNLETGDEEWSFEPWRVREFPVKLQQPHVPAAPASAYVRPPGMMQPTTMPTPRRYSSSYIPSSRSAVQYFNYLSANPQGVATQRRLGLTVPAVVWASKGQSGGTRCARLLEDRLLLFDEGGIEILRTDLPLAGKRVVISAQFLGIAGRKICLQVGNNLHLVDVVSFESQEFDLQEVAAGRLVVPLQVVLDGIWAYALGPGGILCVNVNTARRSFRVDWPDELFPATANPPPGSTPPIRSYVNPSTGQRIYPGGPPMTTGPTYRGVPGTYMPSISCVNRGVLYATVAPNEVAALSQRDPDGQQ